MSSPIYRNVGPTQHSPFAVPSPGTTCGSSRSERAAGGENTPLFAHRSGLFVGSQLQRAENGASREALGDGCG